MADVINYNIYKNTNYEVLTDLGFKSFDGIIIGENNNKILLTFSNGCSLICTPNHKIMTDEVHYKLACELSEGDMVFGGLVVSSTKSYVDTDPVYELLNISDIHRYLVNGILSHQCLIVDECAFIAPHIMDEFWNSVVPIISSSSNTKIFLISCVTGDTYVYTDKGIKQVKHFSKENIIGGYEVEEYKVLGKDKLRTGKLFKNSGLADTKKIKTSFSELECSVNHKLWACKNGAFDWYKAEELAIDDYVSIQYGMNIWGENDDISSFVFNKTNNSCQVSIPKQMNTDLGYFIGLYISEGYARKGVVGGQVTITCGDDLTESVNTLGYNVSVSKDGLHYSINSKELTEFLIYLGFDLTKKAPQKIIPSRIFEMSKPILVSILQGMFDGAGTTHGNTGNVSYTSTSETLIDQLRIILNNFGILSCKYYYISDPTDLVDVESERWVLEISGKDSAKFYNDIGFRFNRKQCRQKLLESKCDRNPLDIVPISQDKLVSIIKHNKIKHRQLKDIGLNITAPMYSKSNPSFLTRKKWISLLNSGLIRDPSDLKFLSDCISDKIKWVKIKSITDSKSEVYDFSLPDGEDGEFSHSIIYNGIIGHQTANGTSNKFYDIYSKAERSESKEWHHERIDWWEIPGRGKKWQQDMIESLGSKESFEQEFGNCFLETGESAISGPILDRWRNFRRPPILTLEDGHYQIWEEPKENRIYSIGVDVSEGVGEAASVAQVLDITDLTNIRQVACFHDALIDPHFFAEILFKISNQWGRPYLAIERNNAGGQVLDALYHTHGYNKFLNITSKGGAQERLGIYSSTGTKYKGVSNMRYWINTLDVVEIQDIGLIHELETFIRRPNGVWKKKDGQGVRDDRVDALFWALIILETEVCQQYYDIVAFDDRGKPKKIKNVYTEPPEFYKLDKMYQTNTNSPTPLLFGFGPDDPDEFNETLLKEQGWITLNSI